MSTVIAASIAALVAVVGYLLNQQASRRQTKAEFYSRALRSIKEVEELPYRIAERGAEPTGRVSAAKTCSDAFVDTAFFKGWLYIDNQTVGKVYDILSQRSMVTGLPLRKAAWENPVPANSKTLMDGYDYYDSRPEWNLCITVMRNELRLFPTFTRHRSRAAIARHIEMRRAEGFDDTYDLLGIP
jgi:hypothetical protein